MTEIEPTRPMDFPEAKGLILSVLWNRDPLIACRDAMELLTRRNQELQGGDGRAIREALRDQLVILEAVFLRFMGEAAQGEKRIAPNKRRDLAAIGLKAQAQFVATAAAVHQLEQEARDVKAIEA